MFLFEKVTWGRSPSLWNYLLGSMKKNPPFWILLNITLAIYPDIILEIYLETIIAMIIIVIHIQFT